MKNQTTDKNLSAVLRDGLAYEFKGLRPKTILRHMRVMPELLIHPNEKPVSLAVEIIQRLTVKGELVADLFAGSGSVAVACIRVGRKFIGIEISEEYCRIAKDRIQAEQKGISVKELKQGQKVLFRKDSTNATAPTCSARKYGTGKK